MLGEPAPRDLPDGDEQPPQCRSTLGARTDILWVEVALAAGKGAVMRIGVLGSGTVGLTLASAFEERGHDVVVGTRNPGPGPAAEWGSAHRGSAATFADAANHADLVVLALAGAAALDVAAGLRGPTAGKTVLDVTNPLDFGAGFPPRLATTGVSLGEQVQEALPDTRVVKALNTVSAATMVDPGRVPGDQTLPLAGDEAGKAEVRVLLRELGWPDAAVLDLGPIRAARGMEALVLFWIEVMQHAGTPDVGIRVVAPR